MHVQLSSYGLFTFLSVSYLQNGDFQLKGPETLSLNASRLPRQRMGPFLPAICVVLLAVNAAVSPVSVGPEDYPAADEAERTANNDIIFDDYRGKGCVDDSGFVYKLGERFFPGHSNCPCVCTEDGPVCDQPECPKIHPKCTKVEHNGCCPECKEVKNFCEYRGKTYKILEEFKVGSRCPPE